MPTYITLSQLPSLKEFQNVNVLVKIVNLNEPIVVMGGKTKQDVIVGDHTATATLTLWEKYVSTMENNGSYS